MVRAANTRRGHAPLLTLWIGDCLVLEYRTMAGARGWLGKPCVEPGQNMGSLMDCGQVEPCMQRQALNMISVNEGCMVKDNLDEKD